MIAWSVTVTKMLHSINLLQNVIVTDVLLTADDLHRHDEVQSA